LDIVFAETKGLSLEWYNVNKSADLLTHHNTLRSVWGDRRPWSRACFTSQVMKLWPRAQLSL